MTTEAPSEHEYKSAYWLGYPMVYVDSYGWAWGLTSDCQTVCAGRVEKLPKREGSGDARNSPKTHHN